MRSCRRDFKISRISRVSAGIARRWADPEEGWGIVDERPGDADAADHAPVEIEDQMGQIFRNSHDIRNPGDAPGNLPAGQTVQPGEKIRYSRTVMS